MIKHNLSILICLGICASFGWSMHHEWVKYHKQESRQSNDKTVGDLLIGHNYKSGDVNASFIQNRVPYNGGFGFYDRTDVGVIKNLLTLEKTGKIGIGTTTPSAQVPTTETLRHSNFGAGAATFDANGIYQEGVNGKWQE